MKVANAGVGALVLALVVTGVAGTIYKITAPDGWLADAFHRSSSAGLGLVGALGVAGLFFWISRGSAVRTRNQTAPLFVYAFAAAGVLYLARFWMHGSL
jgi:hypothetical protein